jgi:hypothetical protein
MLSRRDRFDLSSILEDFTVARRGTTNSRQDDEETRDPIDGSELFPAVQRIAAIVPAP